MLAKYLATSAVFYLFLLNPLMAQKYPPVGIGLSVERHLPRGDQQEIINSNFVKLKTRFGNAFLQNKVCDADYSYDQCAVMILPITIGINSQKSIFNSSKLRELDYLEVSPIGFKADSGSEYGMGFHVEANPLVFTHEKIGGFTGEKRFTLRRMHLLKIEFGMIFGNPKKFSVYGKGNFKIAALSSNLRDIYNNHLDEIQTACPECTLRNRQAPFSNTIAGGEFGIKMLDAISIFFKGRINGQVMGGINYYGNDDPDDLEKRNELYFDNYQEGWGFNIDFSRLYQKSARRIGKFELFGNMNNVKTRFHYAKGLSSRYDYSDDSFHYLKKFTDQNYKIFRVGVRWTLPMKKKQ